MWWRYPSNGSNYHRGRANAVSRIFLCSDYLSRPVIFPRDLDLTDEELVLNAIRTNPACVNCHVSLDPLASYLSGFQFKGSDQQKRVADLSGGERNRLHLAKLLKEGGNVLLLDEPTNDLDVETLRALEEALLNFPGSALVISHDRWFLDRVATHILAFEDDGEVVYFEGNFSEYDEDHKKRKGDSAMVPQRMKYKKLA
jgi:ATPase subunit of ABC transporter with duplicated ATPase domains